MTHKISKLVDVRTSPVSDRIGTMNDFADAGYEVNVVFSPVIYYEGWLADWKRSTAIHHYALKLIKAPCRERAVFVPGCPFLDKQKRTNRVQ